MISSRLRANAGWLSLLGLLTIAAALLVTASPRVANGYTDRGLAERVASLGYTVRDVSYSVDGIPTTDARGYLGLVRPENAERLLGSLRDRLPDALGERLSGAWYSVQSAGPATGPDLDPRRRPPTLSLREQSGARDAVDIVEGSWPNTIVDGPVEAVLFSTVARHFNLRVGSTMELGYEELAVRVVVVGIVEAHDPSAPIWAEESELFEPFDPVGLDGGPPARGVMLTDHIGMITAAGVLDAEFTWRFRVDETALTMANLPAVTDAVLEARRLVPGFTTLTGLDRALVAFAELVRSARALLVVVQASVAATLFGLIVLAAHSAGQRRRGEFALLRSRGASLAQLGGRLFAESALVVAIAMAVGYVAGSAVPGRPDATTWLGVPFGVAAALAAPILAMTAHRRVTVAGTRSDLIRHRVSPRRITAELTLVALAAGGVALLRRRGLGSDVDPFLAVLPVLVAAAAAVVTLRLLPYPLRLLAAGAARARGAVAFLGLARAGRAATAVAGPVAVLVVAVSVGAFCAAISSSVSAARDQVADIAVPGDAVVTGGNFPRSARDDLGAVTGVQAVAAMLVDLDGQVFGERLTNAFTDVTVLIVEAPELADVLQASGNSQRLPDALLTAPGPADAAPAVISPAVAAALAGADDGVAIEDTAIGSGTVSVRGRTVPFEVAAVVPSVPGVGIDATRFIALPWDALPGRHAELLNPTAFALAGDDIDVDGVLGVGDAVRRDLLESTQAGAGAGPLSPATLVRTHEAARAGLEAGGVDRLLGYTYAVGLTAGLLLALLAVGFSVATGARSRGEALSRLRTMGLAQGQGRRLLAYELQPLIGIGALVGAAVGMALPALLGPALGLSAFSDGIEVVFVLDPIVPGLAFALVVVAVVVAMAVEATMNRRARLGAVLRVGGES